MGVTEAIHEVQLELITFEVKGEWESADETTGYKGGWSTFSVQHQGIEMYQYLSYKALELISEKIVEENY